MARICFEGVTRHFSGAVEPAVAGVDLEIDDGQRVALVGPPASGKTTLLRLAGGLEVPDLGRVLLGDDADDNRTEVAMVFQNYAIYPHLSVRDNIANTLVGRLTPRDVEARVDEAMTLLGLGGLIKRPASSLSASERMRVTLARSVARRPGVLLMDEPLANLEPAVRRDVRDHLVAALQACRVTTLYATEDREEAAAVADRVVRVEGGRVHI